MGAWDHRTVRTRTVPVRWCRERLTPFSVAIENYTLFYAVSALDTVLLIKYRQCRLHIMFGSGVPSVVLWLVVAWLFAVGVFMALLYASGKRDRREHPRA